MAKTLCFDNAAASYTAHMVVFNATGVLATYPRRGAMTIGRSSSKMTCDISLPSPIVSRLHGKIVCVDGGCFYRDVGSTNGTYLNGRRFEATENGQSKPVALNDGDVLCFDIVQNGLHHPDRLFVLFTTALRNVAEWRHIPLKSSMAEIRVGRSQQSALKINNTMISEKPRRSFWRTTDGQLSITKARTGSF